MASKQQSAVNSDVLSPHFLLWSCDPHKSLYRSSSLAWKNTYSYLFWGTWTCDGVICHSSWKKAFSITYKVNFC